MFNLLINCDRISAVFQKLSTILWKILGMGLSPPKFGGGLLTIFRQPVENLTVEGDKWTDLSTKNHSHKQTFPQESDILEFLYILSYQKAENATFFGIFLFKISAF
jgi:hypothetical protein